MITAYLKKRSVKSRKPRATGFTPSLASGAWAQPSAAGVEFVPQVNGLISTPF